MKKFILILVGLIFCCNDTQAQISSQEVIATGYSYLNHQWTASSNNIYNYYCQVKYLDTPDWVQPGVTYTGLPYCWFCNSSIAIFDQGIAENKSAGDSNTSVLIGADPFCSVGVDCSGFVSRCYGLSQHYSTANMGHPDFANLFGFRTSFYNLIPGDMVNKAGSHVRLVISNNANGTINTIEAAGGSTDKVVARTYSYGDLGGYRPQYYKHMLSEGSGPEIVIEQMWTEPGTVESGQSINLGVEIKNLGQADASPINTRYQINGADVGTDTHALLSENQSVVEKLENYVFQNAGDYNYCVYVDGVQGEVNTLNNSYCINVHVEEGARPDLIVEDIWTVPTEVEEGEPVDLFVKIKNVGDESSAAINFSYTLNGQSVGTGSHGSLGINQSVTKHLSDYEFDDFGNFDYCVNISPQSQESNTSNNNRCEVLNVIPARLPDLVVEDLWMQPAEPVDGEEVDMFVRIRNIGDEASPGIYFSYKIDGENIGYGNHAGLDINEVITQRLDNHIFDDFGEFEYCVSVAPVEDEENLVNNVYCEDITVLEHEDILITEAEVDPEDIMAGDEVLVNAIQRYNGYREEEELEDFKLRYYLSTDCTVSNDDLLLGDDTSSIGTSNRLGLEVESVLIPNTLIPDTYYIIFEGDSDNQIDEQDETNNTACIEVQIENPFINGDNLQSQVYIYPNPNDGIVQLMSRKEVNITGVELYDSSGSLVRNYSGNQIEEIDMTTVETGTYIMKIYSESQEEAFFRVIRR